MAGVPYYDRLSVTLIGSGGLGEALSSPETMLISIS
jgi:hypothetical protein